MAVEKCPCGSTKAYTKCCEPYIKGTVVAETPEAVMRSRYAAYARTEVPYILSSTHPDKQKECDENAIRSWSENAEWDGLQIIKTEKGGKNDTEGVVEFVANFTEGKIKKNIHELASFKKIEDKWYYFDSEMKPFKPFIRSEAKVSRNDDCPCGSGKKYKKCCA